MKITSSREMADPMHLPPAELSGNLGNTKDSAGKESWDQENEGVSKEESTCSASSIANPLARKKDCKRKIELKGGSSDSRVVVRRSNRCHGKARGSQNNNSTITTGKEKLDSGTFLRYLMHIWEAFPEDRVKSSTYLDPLWFVIYADHKNRSASVLSWIKNKGIFSKKYVFVPIVKWSHWSLLIICNLGESLDSKTNAPCLLLLDSSQATGSTQLEPLIRRFLIDIYGSEERTETQKQLLKMPLLIPKVPQQKNGDTCGFYVLYYIRLFVERAPEAYNMSEEYPNLMGKNWFTYEDVESFSEILDALPVVVSDHDPASDDSSDSVELIMTRFRDDN